MRFFLILFLVLFSAVVAELSLVRHDLKKEISKLGKAIQESRQREDGLLAEANALQYQIDILTKAIH